MNSLRHRLPSLTALLVFEAAGRLGGFGRAARELGISQPAVSRHVQGLEAELGHALFARANNRISLTDPGLRLWHAVNTGLHDMAAVVDNLRRGEDARPLALITHAGFAQQWLMPRLGGLREALGGRPISLSIVDGSTEFSAAEFDVGIRHGTGDWPGQRLLRLFDETVVPVVAARLAEERPDLLTAAPEALVDETLIHMDEGDRPWMTWATWFRLSGVRRTPERARVRFNHYPLVMAEVVAGSGVGLGWRPLIDDMIESGVVVAVGPEVVRPGHGWWLVWPDSDPDPDVPHVAEWAKAAVRPD